MQPDLLCTRAEIEVALGNAEAELRIGLRLARLRIEQGRPDAARKILQPIYDCFIEGFATMDLCAARALLDELR